MIGNLLSVDYAVTESPDSLASLPSTLAAFADPNGGTSDVVPESGDEVLLFRPVPYIDPETGDVLGLTSLDPEIWVFDSGSSWVLAAKQPEPGDIIISVSDRAPLFQIGGGVVVTETFPGSWANGQTATSLPVPLPPIPPVEPLSPTHVTPMTDYTWDGSDRHHVSADTTNQDVVVRVPFPAAEADPQVVNHELTVVNRGDGGTGNTVRVAISEVCPHQADIVLAVGQSVRLRAIVGSYDTI